MFPSKPHVKTGLETEIDNILSAMRGHETHTPEYAACAKQLDVLYKLKDVDKSERLKPDTLLIVGGNIAVSFMIIEFEQKNIITSKFPSFMLKTR
jgi:hypothetical protein